MINEKQIEHTLELHKKAYELLMWLNRQAKTNSSLLDKRALEKMSSATSCHEWVVRHCPMFPEGLRPTSGDLSQFSHLFSSFFNTSLRVKQSSSNGVPGTTLVAGAKEFKDRRHKKFSNQREFEATWELKRAALTALAEEASAPCETAFINRFLTLEAYQQDLTLWTYACELVRRTEFASQGTAAHRLWLELNEKIRKGLSKAMVLKARSNLLNGFKNETHKM